MGILIFAIHKFIEKCIPKTKDEEEYERYYICEVDYKDLKRKKEKIDNLDCYRYYKEGFKELSVDHIRCPLCKYHLPKQEEEKIESILIIQRDIFEKAKNIAI